jgi:predicted PurR-regulated permease PerM
METLKWLETWIPLIIGILTIVTMISGIFYTLYTTFTKFVKHEIQELTKEFKPNGGSSLKDQVNRLEAHHDDLKIRVDEIYDLLTTPTKPVKTTKPKK